MRLVRCYRCTPQIVSLANAVITGGGRVQAAASHPSPLVLRSQRPDGRRADRRGLERRRRGGRAGRSPGSRLPRGRHLCARHRGALPRERPVGGAGGGLRRGRGLGRAARDRAVLRPAGGARGGDATARRGPRRVGRRAVGRGGPGRARVGGVDRRGAPHGRAPSGSGGSRSRPWSRSPTSWRRAGRLAVRLRRRAGRAAPSCSTRRSPMASPSRPSTPPRAWSGESSSSSGAATACCRSSTPRHRARSRRSAASCTSRSPGRPITCICRGRVPASRAAAPGARRVHSSPRRWPDPAPAQALTGGIVRRGSSTARTERTRQGPAKCRVCGNGLVTPEERTLGRCRDCPSHLNEELLEALRSWRVRVAKEAGFPRSRSSPT